MSTPNATPTIDTQSRNAIVFNLLVSFRVSVLKMAVARPFSMIPSSNEAWSKEFLTYESPVSSHSALAASYNSSVSHGEHITSSTGSPLARAAIQSRKRMPPAW